MGKRLKQQRQGKASPAFMRPARTFKADIRYRPKAVENKSIGEVVEFIDDPGHSAPIMRIVYDDGAENMLIAPEGIKIGDRIQEGKTAELMLGSIVPIGVIPEGMLIYNIEVTPGDGGKMVRAAGSYATVRAHTETTTSVLMPSNKTVDLDSNCRAEIGAIAGGGIYAQPLMKAGKSFYIYHAINQRWPKNRGVKSNPVDHPFGGKQHHKGASSMISRHAPPGAKVGHIAARRVGRQREDKMVRVSLFRGKTLEQLVAMKPEDFNKLLNSRARRAVKRNGVNYKKLLVKIDEYKKAGITKPLRTEVREAVILPGWVGMTFAVSNGKQWQELHLGTEMIGHRIGEYVYTVKRVVHSAPGIRATRGSKFLAVK